MNTKVKLSAVLSGLLVAFSSSCGAAQYIPNTTIQENCCKESAGILPEIIQEDYCPTPEITDPKIIKSRMKCVGQHLYNVIYHAAKLSEKAYENECLDPNSKEENTFGNIGGVAAGFVKYEEIDGEPYVVVTFHGTANLRDAATDLNALVGRDCEFLGNARVHAGFYNRYEEFRKEMIEKVEECYKKTNMKPKVLVTGHSLGGALATLAALDLQQQPKAFRGRIQMITFCSPRVLSRAAHNAARLVLPEIKSHALRIWRVGDTVAKVGMGLLGYEHFGESWGINRAPSEGLLNYLNILSWHSISTMVEETLKLKDSKEENYFGDNVKVNSRHAVLFGAPIRLLSALGSTTKTAATVAVKSVASALFFWRR